LEKTLKLNLTNLLELLYNLTRKCKIQAGSLMPETIADTQLPQLEGEELTQFDTLHQRFSGSNSGTSENTLTIQVEKCISGWFDVRHHGIPTYDWVVQHTYGSPG